MCHECPECGQMCYCDGDDTFMDTGSEECLMGHGAQYGCIERDGTDLRHDDDEDDWPDEDEDLAAGNGGKR